MATEVLEKDGVSTEATDGAVDAGEVTETPSESEKEVQEVKAPEASDSLLKVDADDSATEASEGDDASETGDDSDTPGIYTAFDLPDGMDMDLTAMDTFAPLMEKANMDQEGAQEFVSAFAEMRQAEAVAYAEALESQRVADMEAVRNDLDVGREQFDASVRDVNRALNQHGSKALVEVLKANGLDNNLYVFKFMQSVGKNLAEDSIVVGGEQSVETSPADVLFGSTPVGGTPET